MKVESFDGKRGRTVLAHMVTSTPVLARIAARWTTRGLFSSPWENVVGTWCVEFFRKHDKAPKKAIRTLYEQWAEHHQDKDTARLVERFLAHVSEEHEAEGKLATDHVLDIAGRHFNEVAAVRLKEDIESAVDAGRPDKVTKLVNDYKEVQIGSTSHIDVFLDKEAVLHAFSEEPTDSLITFGNDLDRFFSRMLQRKSFVAFQGPEKSAKSFWLNELAYLAMLQRNRVAFFAIGDLTEEEMIIRIAERAAQRPSQQGYSKWPVKLKIPTSLTVPKPKPGEEGELVPKLTYELKSYENPLTGSGAWNTFQHITQRKVKSKNSYFRMSCHPSDSITIVEVRDKVRDWAADGFSADLVIIDYMDILAPVPGFAKDERDATNKTWKQTKALAQETSSLVITATQADAGSYERRSQTRRNFSTDKRKYAHVDGLVAINVTDQEREMGLLRLAWLAKRRGKYSTRRECYVAGNLAIASPAILAKF